MKNKEYISPKIEIMSFKKENIITTSGVIDPKKDHELIPDEKDKYF